jgi:ferredoxin
VDINSVILVFFSPTQTTEKIVKSIAQGIQVDIVEQLDLTPPEARTREFEEMHDELVIIGAPVYDGRIPHEAVHRLRRIKGNGTPAGVVAVYGNRAYEDALLELRDLAAELGFRPVAGGAFIGEHSYDSESTPIASGRPDAQDLEKAKGFGELIREKMREMRTLDEMPSLQVPGDFPYKEEWDPPSEILPVTDETQCTLCGTCARICPTAAITIRDTVMTDQNLCILCSACVKKCSTGARAWENPWVKRAVEWLSTNCRERKEPEIFL